MRIALFPSLYSPNVGGVERVAAALAGGLIEAGDEVVVVTNRWPIDLPRHEIVDGVPVHRVAFVPPARSLRAVVRLGVLGPARLARTIYIVRKMRAEVLNVHCVSANSVYALLAARLLGLPLVVSMHGELTMDADNAYGRSAFLQKLFKVLVARASAVTACSRATLTEAVEFLELDLGDRAAVVHNGVDIDDFASAENSVRNPKRVVAVGRHVHVKGFDVLIEAMAVLPDDYRLVLVGDGPERPQLELLARTRGINDRIDFLGQLDREQTAAVLHSAEIFVSPSRHEPFGIVNLEAMAAGCAVVATNVGGVPEIVTPGENGLLIAPDDATELADAVVRVATDSELRGHLCAGGRRRAAELSTAQMVRRYRSACFATVRRNHKQDAGINQEAES